MCAAQYVIFTHGIYSTCVILCMDYVGSYAPALCINTVAFDYLEQCFSDFLLPLHFCCEKSHWY